ncbi:hypothetical protein [Streptomyces sp. UG1]|uniref:hypothetical protein n=1 Tax=Streptomyces sp. UG1 TaxID=3417652 RepID=UPI003CEBD8B6
MTDDGDGDDARYAGDDGARDARQQRRQARRARARAVQWNAGGRGRTLLNFVCVEVREERGESRDELNQSKQKKIAFKAMRIF